MRREPHRFACGKIEWEKREMRRHRNVFLYGPGSNSAEFNIWRGARTSGREISPGIGPVGAAWRGVSKSKLDSAA